MAECTVFFGRWDVTCKNSDITWMKCGMTKCTPLHKKSKKDKMKEQMKEQMSSNQFTYMEE